MDRLYNFLGEHVFDSKTVSTAIADMVFVAVKVCFEYFIIFFSFLSVFTSFVRAVVSFVLFALDVSITVIREVLLPN